MHGSHCVTEWSLSLFFYSVFCSTAVFLQKLNVFWVQYIWDDVILHLYVVMYGSWCLVINKNKYKMDSGLLNTEERTNPAVPLITNQYLGL